MSDTRTRVVCKYICKIHVVNTRCIGSILMQYTVLEKVDAEARARSLFKGH